MANDEKWQQSVSREWRNSGYEFFADFMVCTSLCKQPLLTGPELVTGICYQVNSSVSIHDRDDYAFGYVELKQFQSSWIQDVVIRDEVICSSINSLSSLTTLCIALLITILVIGAVWPIGRIWGLEAADWAAHLLFLGPWEGDTGGRGAHYWGGIMLVVRSVNSNQCNTYTSLVHVRYIASRKCQADHSSAFFSVYTYATKQMMSYNLIP